MIQPVPEELAASVALQYIVSKGMSWEDVGGGQVKIEKCPFCKKGEFKFYMGVSDPKVGGKDGLFFCHHGTCNKSGTLRDLREKLGDDVPGVYSRKEWAGGASGDKQEPLPDVQACHAALLGNAEAMDYLVNVRGFSESAIKEMKLGLKEGVFFHEAGKRTAVVYPYLVQGVPVFAKYRTLPPAPKDFVTPKGYETPLYNGDVLAEGLEEIIFVEGEANTIAMLSHGIKNVVGVPGVGHSKKMTWIEALDRIAPKHIFIMFDSWDVAGDKSSQELASRIGFEKEPRKLVIPQFQISVPPDECKLCKGTGFKKVKGSEDQAPCDHIRLGKDFNEWMQKGGGTLEQFEDIKKNAPQFDVTGVVDTRDALTQLEDQLLGKEDLSPTYVTKWKGLNKLVGFEDGDVIDIVAPEKVGKTTFGLNILDDMCEMYGEDGLLVCLEMTQSRLARKWVSKITGFEDIICEPGSAEAKAKLKELLEAVTKAREIQSSRKADLYFAYPMMIKEPEDVFKLIRDCIRRYGVKWVMFDNIQRLTDDTLKNQGHRTTHMSQISKGFAKLAKDNKIKLIRILQPHRIGDNEMITTNDVDGSSQVAKDCDCMMTMWRKKVGAVKKSKWESGDSPMLEEDGTFEPKCRVQVGLTRYSGGGSVDLYFDGARSQVRDYDPSLIAATRAAQQNFNSLVPQETSLNIVVPTEGSAPIQVPKEKITL